jgi:hypothetical protein
MDERIRVILEKTRERIYSHITPSKHTHPENAPYYVIEFGRTTWCAFFGVLNSLVYEERNVFAADLGDDLKV